MWDLSTGQGLSALNEHLSSRSYMVGFTPTSADVAVFEALGQQPDAAAYPHAARHHKQLSALSDKERKDLRGVQPASPGPQFTAGSGGGAPKAAAGAGHSKAAAPVMDPYSQRHVIARLLGDDQGRSFIGQTVTVGGWVKSGRDQKQFAFIALNDGSTPTNLQVVVLPSLGVPFSEITATGTCLLVQGVVKPTPDDVKDAKQVVELHATGIPYIGGCAPGNPIAKTRLGLEFLRSITHMRPRTNTISAVARIRNALAYATHSFFQDRGFMYIHTPILTGSDCEGAGEMFAVSTLLGEAERNMQQAKPSAAEVAKAKAAHEAKSKELAEFKDSDKAKGKKGKAALAKLEAEASEAKQAAQSLEFAGSLEGGLPYTPEKKVDYRHDFFGKSTFLTVSGQLQVEAFCCALSSVYTFGPTFRAENSHTTRHLAEFWMIEPELAFCDIVGNMQCAEDYVRYCCEVVLERCHEDLAFITERIDKECLSRVQHTASSAFKRITYTDAVELLIAHVGEGKVKFQNPVEWGIDLASEHERYLCEVVFKQPTIVYNYPKAIKSFYMRVNDKDPQGRETVAAMDILVPGVGELIGGSQREEREDVLRARIIESGLDPERYEWYLDLRKFGTTVHSGFGLGFERLVLFVTGIENIRDVIPFPRYPGHCDL